MIYFDNAATTPMCEAAKEALLNTPFGNPAAPHALGLEAERALKDATQKLAARLACKPEELVFTASGTEAGNLGILGAALAIRGTRPRDREVHILASLLEHPATTAPLRYLEQKPGFRITFASPAQWEAHIGKDTALVCLPQTASETGDCYTAYIERVRAQTQEALIFVDGAQGFGKFPPLRGADLYAFSGHKIHGPKGVGGLAVRTGLRLVPLMYGGGQQDGRRPGTLNVPGIAAMAAAAEALPPPPEKVKRILEALAHEIPDTYINRDADAPECSPYILSMSFLGVRGETLVSLLSEKGLCASMGSACRGGKNSPLLQIGFDKKRADAAVRFSFSGYNTVEEARQAKEIIRESVASLRGVFAKRG